VRYALLVDDLFGMMKVDDTDEYGESSCDELQHHPHAEQYLRQSEWIVTHQEYKERLLERGMKGYELLEAMANFSLEHKVSARRLSRCLRCWHPPRFCICDKLQALEPPGNLHHVKLLLWMHHKEYLSGGNSAKLLLSLLPDQTELFVFGKTGEMDRLEQEILNEPGSCAILWPSKEAISVSEFLHEHQWEYVATPPIIPPAGDGYQEEEGGRNHHHQVVRFLVIDGTYNMARNMYKCIRKRLGKDRMPCTVRVDPSNASIFHRAHKNYGQAHLQDTGEVRRVSTAEACGILLTEISGDDVLETRITEALQANNHAIASSRGRLIDSNRET